MSLGPKARALLDEATHQYEPSPSDADRIFAKLGPKLAGAAAATGAATLATKSAAAKTALGAASGKVVAVGLGTKIVASVALASAVGMGAMEYVEVSAPQAQHAPAPVVAAPVATATSTARPVTTAPPPARVEAPAAEEVANVIIESEPPSANAAAAKPVAATAPVIPATSPVAVPPPSPPAAPSTLEDELALLRRSEVQLRSGDALAALATLDDHARRHPTGALAEERMAARVFALCALGRVPEARTSAESLLASHPSSPHAARIRASCITTK